MLFASLLLLPLTMAQIPKDAQVVDLKDGYQRVTTSSYSIDIPKGWDVSLETPWGARKIAPGKSQGELGVMTAPPTQQSWDELYRTALYFIMREEPGKATPYRLGKTEAGLETASFEVLDDKSFPSRRYVMIRNTTSRLLALSVKVPSAEQDREWRRHFERMVQSAKFKE